MRVGSFRYQPQVEKKFVQKVWLTGISSMQFELHIDFETMLLRLFRRS